MKSLNFVNLPGVFMLTVLDFKFYVSLKEVRLLKLIFIISY